MRLRWCGGIAVTGLLVVVLLSGTAVGQQDVTVEGPALPVGELEGDETGSIGALVDQLEEAGYEPPPVVYRMDTADGLDRDYLVLANTSGHPGILSVTGANVSRHLEDSPEDLTVVVANRSELRRDGEPAGRDEINANVHRYRTGLAEIKVDYSQYAVHGGLESRRLSHRQIQGRIHDLGDLPPGHLPDDAGVDVMSAALRGYRGSVLRQNGDSADRPLVVGSGPNWWASGPARLDVIVLGEDWFAVTKHRPVAERNVTADEIAAGEAEEGERVAVTGNVSGSAVSVKGALLEVAQCAPESVLAPVVDCIPLTSDATVHTGVIGGETDVVAYGGISNHEVDGVRDAEDGRYRLVGEVVSADEFEATVPGEYALRVEYMEQESPGGVSAELRSAGDVVVERVVDEVTSVAGTYGDVMAYVEEEDVTDDRYHIGVSGGEHDGTDLLEVTSVSYDPQYGTEGDVVRAVVTLENTGNEPTYEGIEIRYGDVEKYSRPFDLAPGEQRRLVVEHEVEDRTRAGIIVNGERHGEMGHFPHGMTPTPSPTIAYGTDEEQSTEDGGGVSPAVLLFVAIASLLAIRRRG